SSRLETAGGKHLNQLRNGRRTLEEQMMGDHIAELGSPQASPVVHGSTLPLDTDSSVLSLRAGQFVHRHPWLMVRRSFVVWKAWPPTPACTSANCYPAATSRATT